jgi:hypothetical protein
MKYFTPALLVRFGSTNDATADAAQDEWERAHAAYLNHLKAIRPQLPRSVRGLLRRYYLHDAKVLTMAIDETPCFSLFLQLSNPANVLDRYIELTYRLSGRIKPGLRVIRHVSQAGEGKPFGWWLYDEIDVLKGGPVATLTHSILFTAGCELQLHFSGFRSRRLRQLMFPTMTSTPDEVAGALGLLTA